MKITFSIAALSVSLFCSSAHAGTDPERSWFTLESAHFAVHSYDGGETMARRVATVAEEAKRIVDPLLGYAPKERVHIRLEDGTDGTNGFAWVIPFDTIVLYAQPPAMGSALSTYDDWLRMLLIHEYAHIVHLDNATGVPEAVNEVLGKTFKPNQALPRWFTEGLATWVESSVTGGGRVRSSRFEMMLRAAALADRLPSLSELTGEPLFLPRGTSWYLYGAMLVDHIASEVGDEPIRTFLLRYGRRVISYGMNILARQTLGKDLPTWHAEVLEDVRARAQQTLERVEREGRIEGRLLTRGGESRDHPRFTPDGDAVVIVRSDGHRPAHLTRIPLAEPDREEDLFRCDGGCGRFDVAPDGQIVVSMGRVYRQVNHYSDLFELPPSIGQPRLSARRLTEGARARDPAIAADGRTVWTVRGHWGRTWLEAYDRRTGASVRAFHPPEGARIDAPQPHPDGRRLFASMHHKANRDLVEIDLETGALRRLTWGASDEVDLTLTPDGRWLLYASDADGVYDIYARDVAPGSGTAGHTVRLTRVVTGAFAPRVSPDGSTLVYVGWTVDGDELYAMDFAPDAASPVAVPDPRPGRPEAPRLPEARVTRRDYSAWPTLLPRRLGTTVLADSTGLVHLGASVGGLDVTERIGAGLSVLWDVPQDRVAFKAETHLSTSWPDVSVAAGRFVTDGHALFSDAWRPWREEVLFAELGIHQDLPHAGVDMGLGASATLLFSRAMDGETFEHTPDAIPPWVPDEGLTSAFELRYGLSDVSRPAWAISPHRGYSASLALRLEPPRDGADGTAFQVRSKVRGYIPLPWAADHVLALSARGAWSGGPEALLDRHRLGGVPDQDLLADLIQLTGAGSAWLRGYPADVMTGSGFHLLTGEWRLPVHRLRRGFDTLPIFARDVALAVFADAGWAGDEPFEPDDMSETRVGVGAELRLVADILFGEAASLRLGYAMGLADEGIHHAYVLLAPPP